MTSLAQNSFSRNLSPLIALPIFLAAAGLTYLLMGYDLARLDLSLQEYDTRQMVLIYSSLPRLVTALICGAALAVAGAILQQVLRNPLASPTTMGVSAGAHLALILATLFAPSLLEHGRQPIALFGGLLSACVVFGFVMRRGFSPVSMVLAGLMTSLYCGALATLLILLNDRYLISLFIWGAGSLSQQDWSLVTNLLPQVAILSVILIFLARPMGLLVIGDSSAKSLGLDPNILRVLCVLVAIALSAVVTSNVGVIGFIGLIAPTIARLSGARRTVSHLIWSAIFGALILWFTDSVIQYLAGSLKEFVPTGAVTALFGSPLLLLLIPRLKMAVENVQDRNFNSYQRQLSTIYIVTLFSILGAILFIALTIGRTPSADWNFIWFNDWAFIQEWRLPRVLSAFGAGVMLALAGSLLQRLSNNEMASPEVLGINAGAMIGICIGLFVFASSSYLSFMVSASCGAFIFMLLLFGLGRKNGFQPERMVLVGISLGAMLDAFVGALAATGDIRSIQLLQWMAGSTYGASMTSALTCLTVALILATPVFMAGRAMNLMQLGGPIAGSLGLKVKQLRLLMFGLASLLTAGATIIVGPFSFIGLMAPHIASGLGFKKSVPQFFVACIGGGTLMIFADWIGRVANHPYEIPAGILSALVGTPLLLILMSRRGTEEGFLESSRSFFGLKSKANS
ncbi:Fe(3+)-hydroxamate ABC transporter permease FhuB [Curvivirga aplysinae]|uniref:Fe(3+)-hydroxamate ABC transporter permease FhuB n=1 Tax=Curvivirga aplysinae TaxID=2529852 RepID=UPI0012BB5656|nr:Fe(3+)-hydroxamate ABC transporter permease FhuB [Curvivirga aplysinae]MTI10365.1 Fe(3+)-hydroxamate ABC transporter permease FhuB [Curvivirga aplysinae]